jgi:subtilisin family serine protease
MTPFFLQRRLAAEFTGHSGTWSTGAPSFIDFYYRQFDTTTRMVNSGVSAGLLGAWNLGYTGSGVVIGIVDDGIDGANYDIAPNYRADLSRKLLRQCGPSQPPRAGAAKQGDNPGTAVAGGGRGPRRQRQSAGRAPRRTPDSGPEDKKWNRDPRRP